MIKFPLHSGIFVLHIAVQFRITDRAKPGAVFQVLELSFQILRLYGPCAYNLPGDASSIDSPEQFSSNVCSMGYDPKPKVFTVAQVMPCVVILLLEVDEINVC